MVKKSSVASYEKNFHAKDISSWREWLAANHDKQDHLWLIIYKKESGVPSVYYSDAVDEALCFGWVDSKPNFRDEESYYQFFAPRNPKSNWSKVNKEKVARLIKEKRMAAPGLAIIEEAKKNGAWNALDEVEQMIVPDDLQVALVKVSQAMEYFDAFPRSSKKNILEWIFNAKKPETRMKRIEETARLAGENIRANHYRQPKNK